MQKEFFYTIKIKNKNVYLMVNDGGKYVWTNKKSNALYFQTEKNATDLAKKYFKKFSNWEVSEVSETV